MYLGTLAPVSNRASWQEAMEITDADTGDAIDLTTASNIELEVRDPHTQSVILSAELDDGIEIADDEDGVFIWTFTKDEMGAVCAKTYDIGITVTFTDETTQLFIGQVPVLEGVVR